MNKTIKRFISVILCAIMLTGSVSAQTVTVTNSYANCRSKAGAANTYMGRVYAGQTYELLGTAKAPNGKLWYKIQMGGKPVYICSAFAKLNQTNNGSNNNSNTTTNNTNNSNKKTLKITYSCNVRSAAGQNNRWLGRANYGNTYTVLGEGKAPNGKLWYKIQYGSQVGWVCSSFVKVNSSSPTNTNTNNSNTTNSGKKVSLGTFTLTAYCLENYPHICNDGDASATATGVKPKAGRTIAVDPKVIPYGSVVIINGHEYVAEDTGGAIKGKKIDVCFSTHKEAQKFGRQKAEVFIIK